MRLRSHRAALAATFLAAANVLAQTPVAALRGVAYDSVRARPLPGAFVTLDGGRSTESDSRGRFAFDSVALGEHVVAVQHAALDSLGFNGLAARTQLTESSGELRVATPSFAAMWNAACRAGKPPKDSGFVYGTVVDAETHRPLPGAVVGLTWLDLGVSKGHNVNVQQFAGAGRANAEGSYVICGVPVGLGLRMQANVDSTDSGVIEVMPTTRPVQRFDFAIAHPTSGGAAATGVVVGRVTGAGGAPVSNARVFIDGDTVERRTDERGVFVARNVPIGTRQVEALAIGMSPKSATLDVTARDTARFIVQLDKVQALDLVRVTASPAAKTRARDILERQRAGVGYMRDTSQMVRGPFLSAEFDQFPGTRAARGQLSQFVIQTRTPTGGWCNALLFIDGVLHDASDINFVAKEDIAVIEMFPRYAFVPPEFTSRSVRVGACGAAVVWTKSALK